jgi:hypothetical protein
MNSENVRLVSEDRIYKKIIFNAWEDVNTSGDI